MYQIEMVEDHILVQKVDKNESEFSMAGEADKRGAVFKVCHAPKESAYKANDLVLLHPETYPGFYFEGELYTKIREEDIIATVKETK